MRGAYTITEPGSRRARELAGCTCPRDRPGPPWEIAEDCPLHRLEHSHEDRGRFETERAGR